MVIALVCVVFILFLATSALFPPGNAQSSSPAGTGLSTNSTVSSTMTSSVQNTTGSVITNDSSTGVLTSSATSTFNASSANTVDSSTISSSNGSSSAQCASVASTNSTEGLTLQTQIAQSASLGDTLCIATTIQNDNQTTISSITGSITVVDQNGDTVFSSSLVPFQAGSVSLTTGQQITFQFTWNTTEDYQGVVPAAGTYTVEVLVHFIGMQPLTELGTTTSVRLT